LVGGSFQKSFLAAVAIVRMPGSLWVVLLCAFGAAAEEAGGGADAASTGEQQNPTRTAKQAQAALFIEASVRKEVDLALRTYLRCEACQAIAFQVLLEFSIAEQRSGTKRGQLKENHIAMVLDEYGACTPENFEEHHLYELNGTRYLGGSVRHPPMRPCLRDAYMGMHAQM
jgi:hypothetical protein